MKTTRHIWTCTFSCIGMLVLILDSKNVLYGASDGIKLCIYTVIPSLFPFFVISYYLNSNICGRQIRSIRCLGRACGIPAGSESLLLLGLIGGYPVGAQGVRQAYEDKILPGTDAMRMLGFCNNAGPAFVLGMLSGLFPGSHIPWLIWFIHIISAISVGLLLPGKSNANILPAHTNPITFPKALEHAVKAIANICGWVIIFRVLLTVLNYRIFNSSNELLRVIIAGTLELTNGCEKLLSIENEGLRFVICSAFLGFGGICVTMQTVSAVGGLGLKMYLPGKIMQCCISILLSLLLQPILFSAHLDTTVIIGLTVSAIVILFVTLYYIRKKTVAFLK